jgi:tetratricopeptide (TPR) repeat protein
MKTIEEILDALDEKIKNDPEHYFFNNPVSEDILTDIEYLYNIELPNSYKQFLLKYNGGFICNEALKKIMLQPGGMETTVWNSLVIFGTTELRQYYDDLSDKDWKMDRNWKGVYPVIPMATTPINELLIFLNPLTNENESPVFDAFHEDFPTGWGILYDNFTEFLSAYIRFDGMISTIASDCLKTADDFMPESNWKSTHQDSDDLIEVKEYYTWMIEKFPEKADSYCELANTYYQMNNYSEALKTIEIALKMDSRYSWAYYYKCKILENLKQPEAALESINQAINLNKDIMMFKIKRAELQAKSGNYEAAEKDYDKLLSADPGDAYIYYSRGNTYYNRKLYQDALQDYLKAHEIDPESTLYLFPIAMIYQEIKDYQTAIEYCNNIIELEPDFINAFMIRENCYRELGEFDKADEDCDIINDML